jgi:hypothetical protein
MKSSVKRGGRLTAMLLFSAVGLVACGSDHDDPAAAPPSVASAPPMGSTVPPMDSAVPGSARGSVAAYIAYLRGLRTDETSAPVSVGSFVAPVDDTAPATSLGG